jgi:hypothetical protein
MTFKKTLNLIMVLLLCFSSCSTVFSVSVTKNSNEIDNNESYLIKNVPYVGQKKLHYCEIAAVEMVLKYYGINLSQIGILYVSGGGYSDAYNPRLIPSVTPPIIKFPHKIRLWTAETAGGTDDYKFLAQLYGLQFKYIYPERVTNHEECWDHYWETVKSYIKQDVPVLTGVDPTAWPLYIEAVNLSFIPPKIFGGSHIVVVVGYNETNGTVCVNDPSTELFNMTERGIYYWIGLDIFRNAVRRMKWEVKECRYQLLIFENTSNEPLPEDVIAQLVHERNINRLKGTESAYDQDFINNTFQEYGIGALNSFKNDLETKFIQRIPLHKFFIKINLMYAFRDPVKKLIKKFNIESVDTLYISQYLRENKDLNPSYELDAIWLEKESQYWEQLHLLSMELYNIVNYNTTLKAMQYSKPVINKMVSLLDDIISIKKIIIESTPS